MPTKTWDFEDKDYTNQLVVDTDAATVELHWAYKPLLIRPVVGLLANQQCPRGGQRRGPDLPHTPKTLPRPPPTPSPPGPCSTHGG